MHKQNSYITLTYNDENIPEGRTLVYRDYQLFMKRMRNAYGPIRFFMCGEYGDLTQRPHYHAIIFENPFSDRTLWMHRANDHFRPVYRSQLLQDTWGRGHCEIEPANPASLAYTAGYVQKKLHGPHEEQFSQATGAQLHPVFHRMSRNPGLGAHFIRHNWANVYDSDSVTFQGNEYKPPLYYDRWMDSDHSKTEHPCPSGCLEHQLLIDDVKDRRFKNARDNRDVKEQTTARRLTKEAVHTARTGLHQRDLS